MNCNTTHYRANSSSVPGDPTAARTLRATLVGEHEPALVDALRFGVDEATRSAAPFGVAVVLDQAADAAAGRAASASHGGDTLVLFGGTTVDACRTLARRADAAHALYVDAWCGARGCSAATVRVAPSPAMRVEALAALGPKALGATRWRVAGDAALVRQASAALAGAGAEVAAEGTPHDAELTCGANAEARRADGAGGVLRAVAWDPTREPFGAAQLSQRYAAATKHTMDDRVWAAWAGVKLAVEAMLRAAPGESLARRIARADFIVDAHKGAPLFVRASDRQLVQPLYVVRRGDDGGDRLVGEAPAAVPNASGGPRERLARFGVDATPC